MKGSSIVVLTFVEQWGEAASPNARTGPKYSEQWGEAASPNFLFLQRVPQSGGALFVPQHGHTNDMQLMESAPHLCVGVVF